MEIVVMTEDGARVRFCSNSRTCFSSLVGRWTWRNTTPREIDLHDLRQYMGEEDALRSLKLISRINARDDGINEWIVESWVFYTFKGWTHLASNLKDTRDAIKELNKKINLIAIILIIVLFSVQLEIIALDSFKGGLSFILLFSFIIRDYTKPVIEAITLIFVNHPYDVGDYCVVDNKEVQKIELLQTYFLLARGGTVIRSNSPELNNITNRTRTSPCEETIEFSIRMARGSIKLEELRERINTHIKAENRYWLPDPPFEVIDLECDKLKNINKSPSRPSALCT